MCARFDILIPLSIISSPFSRGLTKLCAILLNNGAFLDAPTGTPPYKTALHIAVSGGHLDIVQLLVKKYKADCRKLDCWGWNVLHEAAVDGDPEIIRFLMKECRELSNQADKLGRTPLLLGLLSNIGDEAVRVMLEMGENVTNEDQVGRGCPEAAILYCDIEVISRVIKGYQKKQKIDQVNKKLLLEIANDHPDSFNVLKLLKDLLK